MRFSFVLVVLFSVLFLSGCASQEAIVRHQAKIDFTKFNSYSLFERESAFTEQQNIGFVLRNSIELAIEKAFNKQGFDYKDPNDADIMVAYVLTGIEVIKPFNSTGSLHICAGCGTSNKKGQQRKKSRKSQSSNSNARQQRTKDQRLMKADEERNIGALMIDILDAKTLRSLWKSEYSLDAENEDSSKEVQDKLTLALSEMMKLYPTNIPSK